MSQRSTPHDALFRAILDSPMRAAAILRQHLPSEIAAQLAAAPEPLDGTFIDDELRNSQSDSLFKVRLVDGRPAYIYALLEHKARPDARTPVQLLRYMTRIWDRHGDADMRRLPPIIPMVVYQGTSPWTVPRSVIAAIDAPPRLRKSLRDLRYLLLALNTTDDDDLAPDPETRAGLMALKYAFRGDGGDRLADILGGLQRDTLLETQIMHYIASVFRDLTPARVRAAARRVTPELEDKMATLVEYCREEGRKQGLEEGKVAAVLLALRTRFGHVDPEVEQRVRATPAERLDSLLQRALTADRLSAVLDSLDT